MHPSDNTGPPPKTYEVAPIAYSSADTATIVPPRLATHWGVYERLPVNEHGARLTRWIADFPNERAAQAFCEIALAAFTKRSGCRLGAHHER